ncbi:MAG: type IV secretory system conjugative DNA transfer family protein [Clostridia bacterium]|nr:type IV secretory system conjugative DNA transfer family protein [Clostridia bacterium]
MLERTLKFFRIKKYNDFMAKFFGVISLGIILFILGLYTSFIFGDGTTSNVISPYLYTIFIACPALGYSYLVNSKMNIVKNDKGKIKWFMITVVSTFIIIGSMLIGWLNETLWWLLKMLPNYEAVRSAYPQVFAPAIKTICLVGPFINIFTLIDYLTMIPSEEEYTKGISGFPGLSVGSSGGMSGPFSCETVICTNPNTAEPVIVPEKKRMEATLVQGATGTGKTAMMLFPMSARDIEKKYFFREYTKKLAYSVLKQGIAYIEGPFSNEYINRNFRMEMVKPKKGMEVPFYDALEKIILYRDKETGEVVYRNLGITVVENDGKFANDFKTVANNFDFDVCVVDPASPDTTLSINPFAIDDPAKVASIIADVLKSMQQSEGGKEETFFAQVTLDAFQNLAILLKEMYPLLNNGEIPSLEDMLTLLYNFDAVEELVEEMKKVPHLEKKYKLLIAYFEKNFYKPSLNINGYEIPGTRGSGRKETERFLYGAITQLNNLLRHPGLKKALCGKTNVINFADAITEGKLISVCSRKGELGIIQSKAFGMFFILEFQDAVLRRPGNEDYRIPHFLYIDEFPEYINKEMDVMFTLFRKYRCGVTVAIQNLSQLDKNNTSYYRQTVLANTKTQIVFGDTVPEDSEYWNKAFGMEKKVDKDSSFDPSTGDIKKKFTIKIKDKERFKVHKIQENKFGNIYYRTKNIKGNSIFGEGKVSFINEKYLKPHPAYKYNFEKYMSVKPLNSNLTNTSFKNGPILEDDDDYIFGKNTEGHNLNKNNSTYEINVKPEPIKEFDFDSDDAFDIVIDTGNNNSPTLENSKLDGGAITESYESPIIEIMNEDDHLEDDGNDSIV